MKGVLQYIMYSFFYSKNNFRLENMFCLTLVDRWTIRDRALHIKVSYLFHENIKKCIYQHFSDKRYKLIKCQMIILVLITINVRVT